MPMDQCIVCRPEMPCEAHARDSGSRPSAVAVGAATPARRSCGSSSCPSTRAGSARTQDGRSASPRLRPPEDLAWARARPPALPAPGTARHQTGGGRGKPYRASARGRRAPATGGGPRPSGPRRCPWRGGGAPRRPRSSRPQSRPPLRRPVHTARGSGQSAASSAWPAERGAVALTVAAGAAPRRGEAARRRAECGRLAQPPEP